MSHFSVLVIGDDIGGQLAPYSEELEVEPYKKYMDLAGEREGLARIHDNLAAQGKPDDYPPIDAPDEVIAERFSYGEPYERDETGFYTWSTYNPKSKWGWWALGGRWLGRLLVKQGAEAVAGAPGAFDNKPKRHGGVDQAYVRDLDWDAMRRHARQEAEEQFELVKRAASGEHDARFQIWMGEEEIAQAVADPERWINLQSPPITVRAVVKDGEWHERGKIGWFGMSSGDKSQLAWQQELSQILADLQPDTLISIVDCHI